MTFSRLLWLAAQLVLFSSVLFAQQKVPSLSGRVVDLTSSLSAVQTADLEKRLAGLEQSKGSQVAVLIVPTTEPEVIEQYSIRVAEVWKLGRKGVDDGAILVVAKNDRTVRIEVGYGLEGALSDLVTKRIIEEVIIPRFKTGDFFAGVSDGIGAVIKVISGEELPPPGAKKGSSTDGIVVFSVFGILIVSAVLSQFIGRIPAAGLGAVGAFTIVSVVATIIGAIIAALIIFVLIGFGKVQTVPQAGRIGRNPLGGGTGWGSMRSGGFGGGGGGFGGGGASGRW